MQDCVFCKIINGDLPSFKIYEDEDVIAILDISPLTTGHTLIIPKKHIADIFEMDESTACRISAAALKISQKLQDKLSPDGLNLHQSNGKSAGQTVFHFHLHLIPRYQNDGVNFDIPKMEVTMEQIKKMSELLMME